MHPVAATVNAIKAELKQQFFERDEAIDGIWLGILINQHTFMLGPPGTSKTYLTRECFGRILNKTYFEATLAKDRPAEAILGPLDIPALRDQGHYHRKTKGFLPESDYGMLDEIGKMPSTLGHNLLTILNERKLDQVNGGRSTIDVPLRSVVGGSNELPTDENTDAAALWDRMVVRLVVEDIQDVDNFIRLMDVGAEPPANPTTIEFADLTDAVDNVIPHIKVPRDVLDALAKLRNELRDSAMEIIPSSRRWRQARPLLLANAFLDGRSEVTTDDIAVLRFALWEVPQQINTVERLVYGVSNPFMEKAMEYASKLQEVRTMVAAIQNVSEASEPMGRLKGLAREVGTLRQKALSAGASTAKIDALLADVTAVQQQVLTDVLGIVPTT